MHISNIYSKRKSNKKVYSNLIYEWEDDFSTFLEIPIYSLSKNLERMLIYFFRFSQNLKIINYFQKIESIRHPKHFTLTYHLYPKKYFTHEVFSNKIPYIIDFDYKVDLEQFYNVYKNCKVILVSSLVAYNFLKKNKCPLNIEHLSLCISDKYKLNKKANRFKEIDVIITRSNKVLLEYAERYSHNNSDFEYVIRRWNDNILYKRNEFISNKRGNIGEFSNRSEYLELLKKSKIAFYATPGIDCDENRFMNHITPSLFEFISSGCRIIARYPINAETKYFDLNRISPSINSYKEFESLIDAYLCENSMDFLNDYEKYLRTVYTSNLIPKLKVILNHKIN